MIGILLVTHGAMGEALLQNVSHILGRIPLQMAQLSVFAQDDPSGLLPNARRLLSSVDSGAGVLVMTDIQGATPANIALELLEPGRVEGVAGLNLPMLLRALTYRENDDMATLFEKAVSGAREGVLDMRGSL